jgi:hypothetical protein
MNSLPSRELWWYQYTPSVSPDLEVAGVLGYAMRVASGTMGESLWTGVHFCL